MHILFLAVLVVTLGNRQAGPGPIGHNWFVVSGTTSEGQIMSREGAVRRNTAAFAAARQRRSEHQRSLNQRAAHFVAVAANSKEGSPYVSGGERTDVVTRYVADVTVPIQNELGAALAQLPGLRCSVSGKSAKYTPIAEASSVSCSIGPSDLLVHDVALPSEITVSLAGQDGEWSVDADGTALPVTIPAGAPTHPYRKGEMRSFVGYEKKGKVRTKVFRCLHTEHVLVASAPVQVRREVADFDLQLPIELPAGPGHLHVYAGETDASGSAQEIPLATKWPAMVEFRCNRATLGETAADLPVEYDTPSGRFAGVVAVAHPDFYQTNQCALQTLSLEAVTSVELAGRPVGPDYPLSPLQWQGDANGQPTVRTGRDAVALLQLGPKDYTKVQPGPSNEKRYGLWLNADRFGLEFHCWVEDDRGEEEADNNLLPGSESLGLLGAIRVISPDGGSVGGVLRVGALKTDVMAALGGPDKAAYDLSVIGLGEPAERSRLIYGDPKFEAWDDSFLYGGIRVKWDGDRVKWFEIARPIQLLENGTRAFEPPVQKTVSLGRVSVTPSQYTDRFVSDLKRVLTGTSLKLVDPGQDPDVVVDVDAQAISSRTQVQHYYAVKRKSYPEGFLCDAGTARAVFRVESRSSERTIDSDPTNPPANAVALTPIHIEHQRCVVNDLQLTQLLEASLLQRQSSALIGRHPDLLSREIVDQCNELSDMAGTVIAINYHTGEMLVNLGTNQGVRLGQEVSEMDLYLLSEVNARTGAGTDATNIKRERLMGEGFKEWLEVEKAGPDWCVVVPTEQKHDGRGTGPAYGAMIRLVDPASGLLRVRLIAKRGK